MIPAVVSISYVNYAIVAVLGGIMAMNGKIDVGLSLIHIYLEKGVPQFDEHFIEQISQVEGVKNISVNKITWAEIDLNISEYENFLKIQHEELYHDGKTYELSLIHI